MKLSSVLIILYCVLGGTSVAAFAPIHYQRHVFGTVVDGRAASQSARFLNNNYDSVLAAKKDVSLDEEVEEMVKAEIAKSKRMSNLRNEKGQEYAPWMNISPEQETKIRAIMREKAEVRRRRQLEEQNVRGSLLVDSQAQELSGTGLRASVLDQNTVELEWATSSEINTAGFVIKRRPAKTDDFTVLASYRNYGSLSSKGTEGGVYRYLDDSVYPGGWVYRVTECQSNGEENDLSQCLVEIQTAEEQRGGILAAAGIAVLIGGAIAAGLLLDPVQ